MFGANVTMRSLKNTDTGIDISVPTIEEIEAPLGGKSTEYEISVFTNLELYKSHLHSKDDVVHFSVLKAYKEVEDFYDRVIKKFGDTDVPSIPKGRLVSKCSVEDKRCALDRFMQHVSQHKDICDSSLFLQFTGINKYKQNRASFSETFSEVPLSDVPVSNASCDTKNVQNENKNGMDYYEQLITTRDHITSDSVDRSYQPEVDPKISELFPKMKVRKSSKPDAVDEANEDRETLPTPPKKEVHVLPSLTPPKKEVHVSSQYDDLDLFEEENKIEIKEKKEAKLFDSDRSPHHGLFDSFNDDASNLFLPSKTKPTLDKNTLESVEVTSDLIPSILSVETKTDDSANVVTGDLAAVMTDDVADVVTHDLADVTDDLFSFETNISNGKTSITMNADETLQNNSLFPDETEAKTQHRIPEELSLFGEQDFGTCITEDDEALFLVEKKESKTSVANPLLSPATEETHPDDSVSETLEELTTLPEPTADLPKIVSSLPPTKEKSKLPPKPAPRPRAKPNSSPAVATEKPSVAPRNVFPPKPALSSKPVPPPKPKHPAKPSTIAQKPSAKATDSSSVIVAEKQNNIFGDLSDMDILQYIEQEEKTASSEASLFD